MVALSGLSLQRVIWIDLIYYKKSLRELLILLHITVILLFAENGLLKLDHVITCSKLKLAFDFKNNALPENLNNLFKYCHNVHSLRTRTVSKEGFFVPRINSTSYGINTLKYSVPVVWHKFSNLINQLSNVKNSYQLNKLTV